MPVPLVIIALASGAGLITWAGWLAAQPRKKQEAIQEKAKQLALHLFNKALENTTPAELKQITSKIPPK